MSIHSHNNSIQVGGWLFDNASLKRKINYILFAIKKINVTTSSF